MYVVNLALDPKALDPESVVAFRSRAYGQLTDHYSIIVPSTSTMTVHLSQKTTVYGVPGAHKALQLFSMYRIAKGLIQSGKCDVITTQDMYFLGLLGLYLARVYHLGLEIQVLGIEKLTKIRKMIARYTLTRAGIVRALSERLKDRLVNEFGILNTHINVVTIYVDVHKLGLDVRRLSNEERTSYQKLSTDFKGLYKGKTNFLTVSRLVPIKRIHMQIDAIHALVSKFPHVMLHIVGEGPYEKALQKYVATLKLENHVCFHGYQTGFALGMYYLECDAFVLTSEYEGWGMVVIEAATAGLPIIMTDVGCAGEFITHGKSGLIVPPNDTNALQEAMQQIIENSKLSESLSVGALNALALLPSFDTILGRYKKNWEVALAHRL